jgi:hypothetical protein
MEPRNSTSAQWTPFPTEFADQLNTVFMDSFSSRLQGQKLIVDGRIYSEEILLRLGFRTHLALRQQNFEVSVDFQPDKDNAMEVIYLMVDFLATVLTEYFEGKPEASFPSNWKRIHFQGQNLHFQFSTVNTDLEFEADQLMGLSLNDLVRADHVNPAGFGLPGKEGLLH